MTDESARARVTGRARALVGARNYEVTEVSRHVLRILERAPVPVCSWIVRHEGGYALVDSGTGWSDIAEALLAAGISSPPTHLLVTHGHRDHVGGVGRLRQRWSFPVVAAEAERPFVEGEKRYSEAAESRSRSYLLKSVGLLGLLHGRPIEVDGTVSEGDSVAGMRVVSLPGHTPGHTGFVHQADGVAISGDAFLNYFGRPLADPAVDIDRKGCRTSIEKLLEVGAVKILPSHGPPLLTVADLRRLARA